MRLLQFCFVLLVFGISAKAQEKETCFYHVSFYKWEWNYCYGPDTLAVIDEHGNLSSFEFSIDTFPYPPYFNLGITDTASFDNVHVEVKSFDGTINYEVKSYTVFRLLKSRKGKSVACKGAYLNKAAIKLFHNRDSGTHIYLDDLKILDPNTEKEILLREIEIRIE